MNVRVPSWIELMGRHAAAGTLLLSGSTRFTVLDGSESVDDRFRFWHGPQNRWRIESEGEAVFVRNPDATVLRGDDGVMRRQTAEIVLPILGQVTPLDLLGPGSMLVHMSVDAFIGPVSSVHIDGRQGWSVSLGTGESDAMTVVLDDETGMTLRMESAGQTAVAAVSDLSVHHDLPDSVFTWEGPLDDGPKRSGRSDRYADDRRQRLDILTAIERAADRRTEVFDVVSRSADPADAAAAVSRLLEVEHIGAEAVLAMQLRRFSTSERAEISAEVQEIQESHPPVN